MEVFFFHFHINTFKKTYLLKYLIREEEQKTVLTRFALANDNVKLKAFKEKEYTAKKLTLLNFSENDVTCECGHVVNYDFLDKNGELNSRTWKTNLLVHLLIENHENPQVKRSS